MAKHTGQLVMRLSYSQLALAINGARITQEENISTVDGRQRHILETEGGILLHSGAKLYPLGNHWYRIMGYGYAVKNKMTDRFKVRSLRVDEQQTLNTLGFAV